MERINYRKKLENDEIETVIIKEKEHYKITCYIDNIHRAPIAAFFTGQINYPAHEFEITKIEELSKYWKEKYNEEIPEEIKTQFKELK